MYQVLDQAGNLLRVFKTRMEATNFRSINGRYDWTIRQAYYYER